MKVLMQTRSNAFDLSGGDTVQMLRTKEALENLGVEVDISLDLRPNIKKYDVVHLFNLTRIQETYIQAQNASIVGKPIVLSTIYWPIDEFEKAASSGLRGLLGQCLGVDSIERLKAMGKYALRGERNEGARHLITHSFKGMQVEVLRLCHVFLPNAITEMRKIEETLGFKSDEVIVVPNAVNVACIKAALEGSSKEFARFRDCIVCVGRIDTRKNQMMLLEALKATNYHLVLVGKASPGHKKYAAKVISLINKNPNFEYIEQIPNDRIYELYKECKVSVLPSWFETPGLASLEAAAMGCNVVVSSKGTTYDYFGEEAFYCDVENPKSIRRCIDSAYACNNDGRLAKKVLQEFTWENAARKTLCGYARALEISR